MCVVCRVGCRFVSIVMKSSRVVVMSSVDGLCFEILKIMLCRNWVRFSVVVRFRLMFIFVRLRFLLSI